MSTKHTPGPWSISYECEHAKHGQFSIETNDSFIALVDAGLIAQQANARLIAAAPELLEALKLLVDDSHPEFIPSYKWKQARAAIAKAIG